MENGVLELRRTATIKPGKNERSGFISTGPKQRILSLQNDKEKLSSILVG